ncbi:hypothetical protein F1C58_14530 [Glaciihabitans sp. INWT7]|uniref:hypothetical protein n=1 Tax=Glaciihabitans sp. INWT7 TaxID=2596912 RepID=UPI00162A7B70|nr:hypothetical protein [Glaciihabitans sp. INWT7]QNE47994.1 hypothetical protein F1C58_14530 [Glaciihabitans sp. INWT7]
MTDTSTGGRFDPRFNPAFQPGYDPAVHEGPTVAAGRAPVPELVEHPLPPVAPVSGEIPAQLPDDDLMPPTRRFDPYLAALWTLSVAFVAAGLLTVRYIADRMDRLNTTGGGSAFDYNLVLVYTIAAPLLVILGLATATATLFVLAARRR